MHAVRGDFDIDMT
jgi:vacuolar protein sorting-associated protein 29